MLTPDQEKMREAAKALQACGSRPLLSPGPSYGLLALELNRWATPAAILALLDQVEAQGWVSVAERLPRPEQLVMVYSPPTQYSHPGEVDITFDCIDPNDDDGASWLSHNEFYEHFCCVAKPEGSVGPSEKAPYTHWHVIPPPPEAS